MQESSGPTVTGGQLTEQVERHWQEWSSALEQEQLSTLTAQPDFISELKRVWEGSDYVIQSCIRVPGLLHGLVESGDLHASYQTGDMGRCLQLELEPVVDEAALHRGLRLFRRAQMVRIIWRDLAGIAPLAETLEDLSALADACVEQALGLLYEWAVVKQGVPRDEDGVQQHMVVLGMGKLGARELNLSSDIDLIFAYPRSGEVEGGRYLSNEQFFTRLSQQLIKAIGSQTVDGFVFRVDTRLRPFGDSGPLAISFDAMEEYYHSQAREWERYAMIKARIMTGDGEAAEELNAMLRPFVYRRYLDFGAIESLRDMKRMISGEMHKRGMSANVKLGPGGIREIEFIGQAFQLIRGGRDPDLQIRPILQVLDVLGSKDLLPRLVVQELDAAYQFLRLVENRLQAWQDRQTHLLPDDDLARLRLARSMGFDDWESFFSVLEQHRARVQGHFDMVFAAPQAEEEPEEKPLQALWRQQLDDEGSVKVLAEFGFHEVAADVLQMLEQFRASHAFRGQGVRGQQRMDQLMPLILEAVAATEDPTLVLERVLKLLESIARRTAYLALLVESPMALSQLVRLESSSPWIASQLTRHPILLDELLDPRQLYSPLKSEELKSELDTLLTAVDPDDTEEQMERLRQFLQSNKLRVAAADVTDVIPLMVVSDYLTEIAETIIARVLDQVWSFLVARHGRPAGGDGQGTGFCVIAYGKMGGIELGYGSDLDLVFIHADSDPNAMTDGERQIANDLFFARLGQRLIHMLTARTGSGLLYEVDMRLRPSGNSGMLVSSLDAFNKYQNSEAWTWEHQALLRARPIAGDPVVAARFQEIRRAVLSKQRDPDKLRQEVVEMREKMRISLDKSNNDMFDLKQGRGGIADIEFMVQYAVLRWAHNHPDLLDWTDNIRLLEALAGYEIFTEDRVRSLADAYRCFRSASHRLALQEQPALVSHDQLGTERVEVKEIWGAEMLTDS
ncbi:MAG: bifunctional [glutamate--ammonia ligase]-adenylyl-L-tyrosine phosphorylase/[glutamate--ammonia-ligase] adenylyltransferase [Gammaproteobacteria bacterium]|nr:bifunctional [glutamate--ammonia ligase]-adenylyl-L-tyrosine phosphorylase/[glutamate--ammonia-ligase] adenylyltransferase [Gammaproteobacteria bacterium]